MSKLIATLGVWALSACSGQSYLVRDVDPAGQAGPRLGSVIPAMREKDWTPVHLRSNSIRSSSSSEATPTGMRRVHGRGSSHPLWRAGAVLTLSGIAGLAVGVPMVMAGFSLTRSQGNFPMFVSGALFTTYGEVALAVGVPMWIVGAVRAKPREVSAP